MKTIDVQTGTTSLEDLVRLSKQEAEIVLTEGPRPVAKVISIVEQREPVSEPRVAPQGNEAISVPSRKLGLHPGAIEASEDFDEPLADEFWLGKE